jgi:ferredoxin
MLKLNQKKLSYTFDRCQQCGICYAVCPENAISLSLRHDGLHDIKINAALCIACGKCVRSCPANKEYGYEGYFDGFAQKKYYLGSVLKSLAFISSLLLVGLNQMLHILHFMGQR